MQALRGGLRPPSLDPAQTCTDGTGNGAIRCNLRVLKGNCAKLTGTL